MSTIIDKINTILTHNTSVQVTPEIKSFELFGYSTLIMSVD